MTTNQPDRLDKIEVLLESFVTASIADLQASNERMTRLEESAKASDERMTTRLEESAKASDERMRRLEESAKASDERMTTRLEESAKASDERMRRLEESAKASDERMTTRLEESAKASDERMIRIEKGLERVEQIVESNNRFLESFSTDIRRYTDTMNNLATRIDGVIATANQDRQETNSRLGSIQSQVRAIAKHLGVQQ